MASQLPAYFRAVAIDYDGTRADRDVKPDTLAVLAEARHCPGHDFSRWVNLDSVCAALITASS